MRVGPSKSMCKHRYQTTLSSVGKEPGLLALRKRHDIRLCQVRDKELNVSEPFKRCRNVYNDVKTEELCDFQDKHRGSLQTVCAASGIKTAGTCLRLLYGT